MHHIPQHEGFQAVHSTSVCSGFGFRAFAPKRTLDGRITITDESLCVFMLHSLVSLLTTLLDMGLDSVRYHLLMG